MPREKGYDPLDVQPATPSSAERFGGEVSCISLGKLTDAEIAGFVGKLGKWDHAIGAPAGLREIVAEVHRKGSKSDLKDD